MSVWKSDETLLSIFNSLLGVSSGDETLHLTFDILLHTLLAAPPPKQYSPPTLIPLATRAKR